MRTPPTLRGSVAARILVVVGLAAAFALGIVLWRTYTPAATPTATNRTTNRTSTNAVTNTTTNSAAPAPIAQPADADRDGLSDAEEASLGTNPASADSDGDGLPDRAEVNAYHTKPLVADSDGDGVSDGEEVHRGTDPNGAGLLLDVGKAINALPSTTP